MPSIDGSDQMEEIRWQIENGILPPDHMPAAPADHWGASLRGDERESVDEWQARSARSCADLEKLYPTIDLSEVLKHAAD